MGDTQTLQPTAEAQLASPQTHMDESLLTLSQLQGDDRLLTPDGEQAMASFGEALAASVPDGESIQSHIGYYKEYGLTLDSKQEQAVMNNAEYSKYGVEGFIDRTIQRSVVNTVVREAALQRIAGGKLDDDFIKTMQEITLQNVSKLSSFLYEKNEGLHVVDQAESKANDYLQKTILHYTNHDVLDTVPETQSAYTLGRLKGLGRGLIDRAFETGSNLTEKLLPSKEALTQVGTTTGIAGSKAGKDSGSDVNQQYLFGSGSNSLHGILPEKYLLEDAKGLLLYIANRRGPFKRFRELVNRMPTRRLVSALAVSGLLFQAAQAAERSDGSIESVGESFGGYDQPVAIALEAPVNPQKDAQKLSTSTIAAREVDTSLEEQVFQTDESTDMPDISLKEVEQPVIAEAQTEPAEMTIMDRLLADSSINPAIYSGEQLGGFYNENNCISSDVYVSRRLSLTNPALLTALENTLDANGAPILTTKQRQNIDAMSSAERKELERYFNPIDYLRPARDDQTQCENEQQDPLFDKRSERTPVLGLSDYPASTLSELQPIVVWDYESAKPGDIGTSVFAGHNTTGSSPFKNLDLTEIGDTFKFQDESGNTFVWQVDYVGTFEPTAKAYDDILNYNSENSDRSFAAYTCSGDVRFWVGGYLLEQ
jgi:hypothetical protein